MDTTGRKGHEMATTGMQYHVRGKLFIDSPYSRTAVTLGTFATLAEAVAFIGNDYSELQDREEVSIDCHEKEQGR